VIDEVTRERWRQEDAQREARLPRCPECGGTVHPDSSIRDEEGVLTCYRCNTVFYLEDSE
jgi:uncharacterized protein YbaR (Trm112 family)